MYYINLSLQRKTVILVILLLEPRLALIPRNLLIPNTLELKIFFIDNT